MDDTIGGYVAGDGAVLEDTIDVDIGLSVYFPKRR